MEFAGGDFGQMNAGHSKTKFWIGDPTVQQLVELFYRFGLVARLEDAVRLLFQ